MSRSTRLSTAIHILLYLAEHQQERVRIRDICSTLKAHPSRLRQITSLLVHCGVLRSSKGAKGGISIAKPISQINLLDLSRCLDETHLFSPSTHEVVSDSSFGQRVNRIVKGLYESYNQECQSKLKATTLAELDARS